MDRIIEVKVRGSHLTKDNRVAGVRGESGSTVMRIDFDESWDRYAKKVVFWDALGQNPVVVTLGINLLEDAAKSTRVYLCRIPGEALAEAGLCTFNISGWREDKTRQKSIPDALMVLDAPDDSEAVNASDPTPTEMEQLQAQMDGALDEVRKCLDNVSGVYVGSGECPEGYKVQIDPEGDEYILATIDDEETSDESTWSSQKIAEELAGKAIGGTAKPEKKAFADYTWEEIAYIAKNFDPSEYWSVGDMKRLEFPNGYSVPVIIADFYKYEVVDPRGYGKRKASLVLQLGADRLKNGDKESGVLEPLLSGLASALIDDETSLFKSPNKLKIDASGNITEAATWWKESAVRSELQKIFVGTELENLVVPVKVVTSKYCNENNGYENFAITADKVFLPSETELYGKQLLSPAIEGEFLEYYRQGASRFFWGDYTLENEADYVGSASGWSIWMRSSAQRDSAETLIEGAVKLADGAGTVVNGCRVKSPAKLTIATETRKDTCRVYNNVLRARTETTAGSYGHGYSIAQGACGYYVPLFCL